MDGCTDQEFRVHYKDEKKVRSKINTDTHGCIQIQTQTNTDRHKYTKRDSQAGVPGALQG